MKVNIGERIEKVSKTSLLIAVFSLLACVLTQVYYPNQLTKVGIICLAPCALMVGWCIGLMDAKQNAYDKD